MIDKKRLVACGVTVLVVGAYLNTLPTHAAESVPKYRSSKTEVTAQYLDKSGNYLYTIEERDGDADVELPNGMTVNLTFDGDGSEYTEDYTVSDDAMCGDVFFTVFDTNGTVTNEDDKIISMRYIGTILPTNME